MSADAKHVVLVGSPRARGRCAAIAREIVHEETVAHGDERAPQVIAVSRMCIRGCTGCNGCAAFAPEIRCAIEDDMAEVYAALDAAERLSVVCPLYFAGPPAQFKALLDRLQPHYWAGTRFAPKRPASLIVVGEGGDPFGPDALVSIVRSALAVAGFRLEDVEARIGTHGQNK